MGCHGGFQFLLNFFFWNIKHENVVCWHWPDSGLVGKFNVNNAFIPSGCVHNCNAIFYHFSI